MYTIVGHRTESGTTTGLPSYDNIIAASIAAYEWVRKGAVIGQGSCKVFYGATLVKTLCFSRTGKIMEKNAIDGIMRKPLAEIKGNFVP